MSATGGIKDKVRQKIKDNIQEKVSDAVEKLTSRKNILLITCDQYRFPRFSYGAEAGFHHDLKEVLGFQPLRPGNTYEKYFPGLMKLRKNSVVLRNHTIAASACTPSRAVIYTGQYGTRTGVTQTDGLFKNGDAPNFPWLDADGIPTLGTWMRHAGYTTHYFGKWHVSNPPEHSLKRWGFDDWEASYPEPHGSQANNLGIYRDVGFTDSACAFIRRMGLANNYNRVYANMLSNDPNSSGPKIDRIPWFAVASFTNPHDIATYPGVVSQALKNTGTSSPFGPLYVPPRSMDGEIVTTPVPTAGTIEIPLNLEDFPQDCAHRSPTQNEDLSTKPSCQHEYAYKMGIALASKLGFNIEGATGGGTNAAVAATLRSTIPFQLADKDQVPTTTPNLDAANGNSLVFLQLYAWLHMVVDRHIDAVLTALEESGQAEDTIVIFLADHGEYGAAHGMMIEKWHTAYAEALHVPMVIVHPEANKNTSEPIQSDALTSHVDIVPTVLGLAGVTPAIREKIAQEMMQSRPVPPLPGVDLTPLIKGEWGAHEVIEPDGTKRKGVLFITDDEITAPLPPEADAFSQRSYAEFEVYCAAVDRVSTTGKRGHDPVPMQPGPVKQPNHVRCVRTASYKLARYMDPSHRAAQEWEMYDLKGDANERTNLVQTNITPPTMLPQYASLQPEADNLYVLLQELERRYLS